MSFQKQRIKHWKQEGYKPLKIIRLNESGFPDLILLKDGRVVFEEVKEEGDTLKPLQKKRIDELRLMGFTAQCVQKNKGIIY